MSTGKADVKQRAGLEVGSFLPLHSQLLGWSTTRREIHRPQLQVFKSSKLAHPIRLNDAVFVLAKETAEPHQHTPFNTAGKGKYHSLVFSMLKRK